jgi:hypothetical protein
LHLDRNGFAAEAAPEAICVGFEVDVVVEEQVILEIKSVARIVAVHKMQSRICLRMSGAGRIEGRGGPLPR